MNKERLKYHFVHRKILSSTSPALTFLSPSRLPACLHSSPDSLPDGSGLPQQLLSPSRFQKLPHGSGLPQQLLSPSRFQKLPHGSGLPHKLLSPSRFQIPHGWTCSLPHGWTCSLPHGWTCSLPHASRSLTAGLVVLRCKFNCIMLHDIFASYWICRVDSFPFFLPIFMQTCRFIKQCGWLLAVIQSLLIIASRKHYTVDVVVAWYTVNLVVFFIDKKLPELPDRTSGNLPLLLPVSSKDKEARTKEENHKLLNGNSVDPADWRQRTQVNGKVLEDGNVHADNAMNGA